MLQFITCKSEEYSLEEEVQMVIEGGCRWIQYNGNILNEDERRSVAIQIKEICRENDTFLIIDHDVELTKELGAYGVHLSSEDMNPSEARDFLGAEPIIGVTVRNAQEIINLRGVDVDYVTILYRVSEDNDKRLKEIEEIIRQIRSLDIELPVVIAGDVSMNNIESILSTGVNGVAASTYIVESSDPVVYTQNMLKTIERIKSPVLKGEV